MRLVQAHDSLSGQPWRNLVQHRLHPPVGTPMFTTDHSVIGVPYGNGIKTTVALFRATDDAAIRAELARHGIAWIVTCPGVEERTLYRTAGGYGLAERLAAGRIPDYFEAIPQDGQPTLRVYRVKP